MFLLLNKNFEINGVGDLKILRKKAKKL